MATTVKVDTVPARLRSIRTMNSTSTPNITGISVMASRCPASAKALLSIDTPESATRTPG